MLDEVWRCGRGMLYIVMDTHGSDIQVRIQNTLENASFGHGTRESTTGHFALKDYKFGRRVEALLTFHFGILFCI